MAVITGTATYRERMLPPPGSVATVTLLDVSRADAPSREVASQQYDLTDRTVPLSFRLEAPSDQLKPNMRYVVRAVIHDPEGGLLWTTDTAYSVDPTKASQELEPLMMVRARGGQAQGSGGGLAGPAWRVEGIDGRGVVDNSQTTLEFGADGRLSGSTGCNQYSTTYGVNGDKLEIGQAAVTQRTCVTALNDQQARFLDVFRAIESYRMRPDGKLELLASDGRTIVASR
ncbi:MAG: META domain-containing protein [Acidobacteria bacterium]|nr:META domain-containing protein [Acidobacteriota bacterium]